MSKQTDARLAVIVVSYNTCSLLRECLRTLLDSLALEVGWLSAQIIVVDNASVDGSAAMVGREFPQVRLLAMEHNLGFTGGNNRALALLGLTGAPDSLDRLPAPDYVLLLNPDTRIESDAVAQMVRFLQRTPDAAICGAGLRYGDGRFQHGAFAFPGVAQVALDLLPLRRLPGGARLYESRLNGRYPRGQWDTGRPFAVDFVLGAALMARAALFRQIGTLDEGYFMYCEEMDFCLRAGEAGWRVFAVPAAEIVHLEGQSSRQVRWPAFTRLWRSRLRFYRLHRTHFAPGTQVFVRLIVGAAMSIGARRALARFARGLSDGSEAGAEIAARNAVLRITQ